MTTTFHSGRIVATLIGVGQVIGSGSPVIGDSIDGAEGRFAVIICGTATGGGTVLFQLQSSDDNASWGAYMAAPVKAFVNEEWVAGAKSTNEARTKGWVVDFMRPDSARYLRVVASTSSGNYNVTMSAVQWGGSGTQVADYGVPSGNFTTLLMGT